MRVRSFLYMPCDLRDRDVALVDDQQEVGREVVDQGPGPRARLAPGQVARVVLDAGAEAHLAHHLEVELGALLQPRRLELAALAAQLRDALLHLVLDLVDRDQQLLARRHVVGGGVDVHLGPLGEHLAGQRVDLDDPLDLVAEEVDPHHVVAVTAGCDLERRRRAPGTCARSARRRCAGTAGRPGGAAPRRAGTGRRRLSWITVAP